MVLVLFLINPISAWLLRIMTDKMHYIVILHNCHITQLTLFCIGIRKLQSHFEYSFDHNAQSYAACSLWRFIGTSASSRSLQCFSFSSVFIHQVLPVGPDQAGTPPTEHLPPFPGPCLTQVPFSFSLCLTLFLYSCIPVKHAEHE